MLRIIAAILLIVSAAAHVIFVMLPRNYGPFAIGNAAFAVMCALAMVLARKKKQPATTEQAAK